MTRISHRGRSLRLGIALLAMLAALSSLQTSSAVQRPHIYRDSFDTRGPLPGYLPSDPYDIRRGDWEVVDLPDLTTTGNPRRVLRQNLRDGTPDEPIMFLRDTSFHNLSVQVTAALIDNNVSSSLGIVFRAPILENRLADADNLYVFSAINTGFIPGFPTGKAFVLFKRVGQGYFPLNKGVVHTWADLTRPHTYKISMVDGHIRAFVDNRLIIEHTDIPSGDVPTNADEFPGLPYFEGSVGLRTSKARAWFDDLVIIADDAYEGRAALLDASLSYPLPTTPASGSEHTLSNELNYFGANVLDTGMVYSDRDFDTAVVRPYEDGRVTAGASLRVWAEGGTAYATSRAARLAADLADPTDRVSIQIDAAKIETSVSASCSGISSSVDLASTKVTIAMGSGNGAPDTVLEPLNLNSSYKPNTVLYHQPGLFTLIAHRRITSTKPRWVQAAALSLVFPNEMLEAQEISVAGNRILPRTGLGRSPGLIVDLGLATAGRTCAPQVETNG